MKKTTYTPYSADNDEIDFGQQLRVIWTNKYKILAALLAGGILGAAFSLASTPQYRADAMLEIETRQNQILTEINSIFNNQTTPSEAEVELVQSRLVLGKTVDDLQLDQEVKAKYTPVIGSLMHNISGDPDPKLTVGSFTVQDEWFNKTFTLTDKSNKAYTLTLPDKRVVEGKVGVPLKINNHTTLKIDQILANPGQRICVDQVLAHQRHRKHQTNWRSSAKVKPAPSSTLPLPAPTLNVPASSSTALPTTTLRKTANATSKSHPAVWPSSAKNCHA